MYKKVLSGIGKSVTDFASNAGDALGAMNAIVGGYRQGDPIKKADVRRLLGAGFNMVQIATFFGVAERVIQEVLEDEPPKQEDVSP